MPIPQVTDRIKEAPAVALRAVFAGIGQLLMAVDKIRAQMQEQATSSQPPRGQADGTSNVTPLRERATPAAKPGAGPDVTKPGAAPKPAAGTKPAAAPKSAAGAKSAAAPKPAAETKLSAEGKPAARTKPGAGAA